jgi:hypothetical protein
MESLHVCGQSHSIVLVLFMFSAYMSSPCHIEVILSEKEQAIAKPTEEGKKKVSQKKLKKQKMMNRE